MAISADPPEDSRALRDKLGLEFPLLFDDEAAVAAAYGVAMRSQDIAVPAVFIVRPDRSIAWRYVGESVTDRPPEDRIVEELDRLK